MTTTDHWREADDRGTVQTHASGDWLMVCIDGRWFLARSVTRVDPGDPPGICRHCGDRTELGDDPAPGLCVMCAKAGRS